MKIHLSILLVLGTALHYTCAHHHPDHSDHPGCDPINCPEDCTVDEKASPCPSCICTEKNISKYSYSSPILSE
ncbi:hypothetical protein NPIL_520631 [Nephila pilipes]|uniref:Spider venom protein n=1 Tax=Nephila pilipes TaxID=299642 RepID=A0A8X6TLB1_NEPPI|nr:hypothetical protein NPIL_520631 [Nephila pilipes]